CNDEKILIIGEQDIEENQDEIHSEKIKMEKDIKMKGKKLIKTVLVFIIWDLFSSNSEKDTIKVVQDSLNLLDVFRRRHQFVSSNGNIIYFNHEDGTLNSLLDHDDLIGIINPKPSSLKPLPLSILQ